MKLKNFMLVMAAAGALTACSSSDDATADNGNNNGNNGNNGNVSDIWKDFTGTQVYVGVEALGLQNAGVVSTRAAFASEDANINYGYNNAFVSEKATATYMVKVDPRSGYPANTYVEVKTADVFTDVPAHDMTKYPGTVNTPYVMSTNGTGVAPFMTVTPTVDDVKAMLANQGIKNTTTVENDGTTKEVSNASATYAKADKWGDNAERIIWYLATDENNEWTVEGILTDREDIEAVAEINKDESNTEVTFHNGMNYTQFAKSYVNGNIKAIDPTLRYDIAQQKHKTWGEIKTSLHIQESKDVVVTLPIDNAYTVDAVTTENGVDTTRTVKVFNQLYYCNKKQSANGDVAQTNVEVKVERQGKNLVITVPAISQDILDAAARKYNDGVTVEIHTFYKLTADKAAAQVAGVDEGTELTQQIWNMISAKAAANDFSVVTYEGERSGRVYSEYYTPDAKDSYGEKGYWENKPAKEAKK